MYLSAKTKSLKEMILTIRRDLHIIPELSFNEFKTSAYICNALKNINVKYKTIGTGVYADFEGVDKSYTLAFRADMDALPIVEKTNVPYKSENSNMHACGHDGHMAILLTFCSILSKQKPPCNVRAIFQFAEEGDGGAEKMIEAGVLKNVDEIFAIHLDPLREKGEIATNVGALFAGSVEFDIDIAGIAAHCAEPKKGKDTLKSIVSVLKDFDELNQKFKNNTLLHCGAVNGGRARNIICNHVTALCTLRYFDDSQKEEVMMNIVNALVKADKEFGTTHGIIVRSVYPPLINSAKSVDKAKKAWVNLQTADARYTAEDFAFYTLKIPGCMLWLGVKDDEFSSPLHSDTFGFNEDSLLYGVQLFQNILEKYDI